MPFETLRETLLKGGVAPRHVRRTLGELADHLADLTAQQQAAGYAPEDAAIRARAALGDDSELAQAILAQPKLHSFAARAPWAVFGLLIPVGVLLAYVVPTLMLVGLAKLHGVVTPGTIAAPAWFQAIATAVAMGTNLILPPLLGLCLALLAKNQRLSLWWPLLGAGLIGMIAMQIHVAFAAPGHHGGSISLGALLWWSTVPRPHPEGGMRLLLLVSQALLALAPVAILSFARHRRDRAV